MKYIFQLTMLKKGMFLFFLIALMNVDFISAQSCKAELSVEKNRNVSSAYQDNGAIFHLMLTNSDTKNMTYTIATKNLEEPCANDDFKTTAPNVSLNVEIREKASSGSAMKSMSLKAGETRQFEVYVTIPANTAFNSWSCIELIAKADGCTHPAASTVLRVYVPEPSEG